MKIMEELRKFKSSVLLGRYPSSLITFIKAKLFCLLTLQLKVYSSHALRVIYMGKRN